MMLYYEQYAVVRDVLDYKQSETPDQSGVLQIPMDVPLSQVISYLNDHHIGVVYLYDELKSIKGLISERDIIRHLALMGAEGLETVASDVMQKNIVTCKVDDGLKYVVSKMAEGKVRHILAQSYEGLFVGVVSARDIELFAGQG
jgi:CBS domain-containing protein